MTNKSYNPLKMIGSYVGGIILVVLLHFNPFVLHISVTGYTEPHYFIAFLSIMRSFSLGFLIGWGIQILLRIYGNKKWKQNK